MITLTIGDLFDGQPDHAEGHHIYVVRDGYMIFYVGRSQDPVDRLLAHFGRGNWGFGGPSQLGQFVAANLPGSREWQIDLLTPGDCKPFLGRWCRPDADDINIIEQALIAAYRPYLNRTNNPNGRPLPKRYRSIRGGVPSHALIDAMDVDRRRAPMVYSFKFKQAGLAGLA